MTLQLRAYQWDDVRTMAETLEEGGVAWNLSEMRTGKLIELIALVRTHYDSSCNRILIVAPLSTLLNVRDEFERWWGCPVYVNPKCGIGGVEEGHAFHGGPYPLVVAVNPEKLRDSGHEVFGYEWDLVALDECHRYRGRQAQQTKGAFKLARKAKRLVLMTGTPLMNGLPRELWPLLHLTDRKAYSSFWRFIAEHAVNQPGWGFYQTQDERAPWTKPGKKKIQDYLAPLVVRRTYAEVRPELPPTVEQTIKLDLGALDPNHLAEYRRLEEEWRVAIADDTFIDVPTKLALTTRLRQFAASPMNVGAGAWVGGKVRAVAEWVADQPGKGVVWCWHRAMAEAIYEAVPVNDKFLVTGDFPVAMRAEHTKYFQECPADAVLVATIGALKEGISLDTASWAVFAERSWLPADNDQAAARIQGPNQQGSPLVVSFVCEGTIEEQVEKVLARKDRAINEFMVFQEVMRAAH